MAPAYVAMELEKADSHRSIDQSTAVLQQHVKTLQAAYDHLSQHPDYKHYHFSATGHSLPIARDTQHGLSIDADGRYRIPEGQRDFSEIPAQARARVGLLSTSPVTKVSKMVGAGDSSPWKRCQIEREDGSRQWLSSNPHTGKVEIEHYGPDGQRSRVELNHRCGKEAGFIEWDAQDTSVHSETVAMGAPLRKPVGRTSETTGHERAAHRNAGSGDGPGSQAPRGST